MLLKKDPLVATLGKWRGGKWVKKSIPAFQGFSCRMFKNTMGSTHSACRAQSCFVNTQIKDRAVDLSTGHRPVS